ncbi:Prefoldin subunit-domain-containing protein [Podospora australis]|uniref:Prefoldin subunit-domain-containing protein n=1 Tax=Podospora australis TaxID=1536484 RepID=A0AAN6WVP6_9PEZI|nr:Prefoldin subunit-domain-containing protein [Podospora australis]
MAQPKDHLSDLDRHVQLLESKVNQLRSALDHWQKWYIDYSALKEEVEQLPTDPPPTEDLRRIRRDFDGTYLTRKEINEIMGKNDLRDTEKIISLLSHRIDYVEQNMNTLQKQLESEENRLAAASVIAHPDAPNDEESGLPITDIVEELDDDDNVVNYRLQSGGDVSSKLLEAFKKAGIEEAVPEKEASSSTSVKEDKPTGKPTPTAVARKTAPESALSRVSPKPKKVVSFTDDTKSAELESERAAAAQKLEEIMKTAKDQEKMDLSDAVYPDNETEEERQLRREMLEYSMSEIGPVVAELQLEEGDFDDEDDWDIDEDEMEDEDDDEDDLGRSQHSVLNADYIKRMQELEKKLGVKSAFAVDRPETKQKADQGVGVISVVKEMPVLEKPASSTPAPAPAPVPVPVKTTKAPKEKKSVSFAPTLDIAPDTAAPPPPAFKAKTPKVDPVSDIVEKVEAVNFDDEEEEEVAPKRVSLFKKERSAASRGPKSPGNGLPPGPNQLPSNLFGSDVTQPAEPTPPVDQTVALEVVERATPAVVAEPDDMDDNALYEAAAIEYARLRNQMIEKQGGFLETRPKENGEVPLDEELGGPKRVSKFKAARLAKLQQ